MCKRHNTSASRVLFWSNTTTLFCIDVWTAQYIRKSGAILEQHYSTFFYRCGNGAIHPQVGCYFEATLQHFFLSMCKRCNTSASRVLFWSNTTALFFTRTKTAWVLEGRHSFWYVKNNVLKASRAHPTHPRPEIKYSEIRSPEVHDNMYEIPQHLRW